VLGSEECAERELRMMPAQPKRYVVQKHIMASSVKEALDKEPTEPVTSVFPDSEQPKQNSLADAIGFKRVDIVQRSGVER
jgi:hypothetical protein